MADFSNEPTQPGDMQPVDDSSSSLRLRHERRQNSGSGRLRKVALWGFVLLVTLMIVAIIATPLIYRNLRPEYRFRISHRLPFMSMFDPQREYTADTLPTVAPAENNGPSAADLLLTPDMIAPAPTTAGPASPTPNEDNVIIVTAVPTATPTEQPTDQPTMQPTAAQATAVVMTPTLATTPLPSATPLPTSEPTEVALLSTGRLYGFSHVNQTWNNCGPATLTMGLSYYGWTEDQLVAANWLKPDTEDKNVSPWQMVSFVNNQTGVRAIVRMGGDLDLVRSLILAGFPVLVETGYMPEGYDWMGHYRLIMAYDDNAGENGEFYTFDSFLGHGDYQGLPISYDHFDEVWQQFNRTFVIIYEQNREGDLREVIGNHADLTYNAQQALDTARSEAESDPNNPFIWFNMGTSYLALDMFEESAIAYDQARNAGSGLPWRMLWYQFGPFEAYYEVGRYNDVLALAEANLGTTPYVEETYYWKGMVYLQQGEYSAARYQFNLAIQHNTNFNPARDALVQVEMLEAQTAAQAQ